MSPENYDHLFIRRRIWGLKIVFSFFLGLKFFIFHLNFRIFWEYRGFFFTVVSDSFFLLIWGKIWGFIHLFILFFYFFCSCVRFRVNFRFFDKKWIRLLKKFKIWIRVQIFFSSLLFDFGVKNAFLHFSSAFCIKMKILCAYFDYFDNVTKIEYQNLPIKHPIKKFNNKICR